MVTPAAVSQFWSLRFDPGWHWDRPHMAALPDHIGDHPVLFSLLEAFHGQLTYLCPSETASEQNSNHSVVTLAAQAGLSQKAKGRFIVIDGKQRLLSLSKFTGVGLAEDQKPLALTGLKVRTDLNKLTFADIKAQVKYESLVSEFENQAIRTVVIRGWGSEEVLYTIFHRLNTGSVPLSPQELRQALHPGGFLSFAAKFSEQSQPLKTLLGLTKPDFRMRDVELVVRFYSFNLRLGEYKGNLKKFLDDTCDQLNKTWTAEEQTVRDIATRFDESVEAALKIFSKTNVFRKWDGERFEKPLNRAVFDVVANSLFDPKIRAAALKEKDTVIEAFKAVCTEESFRSSIESTTKSKDAVSTRFSKWYRALGDALGKKIAVHLPE